MIDFESAFSDDSGRATFASQVEVKISEMPATKKLLPQRRYGEPEDAGVIKSNRTLSAM